MPFEWEPWLFVTYPLIVVTIALAAAACFYAFGRHVCYLLRSHLSRRACFTLTYGGVALSAVFVVAAFLSPVREALGCCSDAILLRPPNSGTVPWLSTIFLCCAIFLLSIPVFLWVSSALKETFHKPLSLATQIGVCIMVWSVLFGILNHVMRISFESSWLIKHSGPLQFSGLTKSERQDGIGCASFYTYIPLHQETNSAQVIRVIPLTVLGCKSPIAFVPRDAMLHVDIQAPNYSVAPVDEFTMKVRSLLAYLRDPDNVENTYLRTAAAVRCRAVSGLPRASPRQFEGPQRDDMNGDFEKLIAIDPCDPLPQVSRRADEEVLWGLGIENGTLDKLGSWRWIVSPEHAGSQVIGVRIYVTSPSASPGDLTEVMPEEVGNSSALPKGSELELYETQRYVNVFDPWTSGAQALLTLGLTMLGTLFTALGLASSREEPETNKQLIT